MKRIYAVIGDPIAHSRSPELYAPMFRRFGIDAEFLRLRVTKAELPGIRDIVRERGLDGFAVTMPHKRTILDYLDGVSESARAAGSANIITIRENKLTGYNTDGNGLIGVFRDLGIGISGMHALILGGGGAAMGAGAAIQKHGGSAAYIKRSTGMRIEDAIAAYARKDPLRGEPYNNLYSADALINATPLGMPGYDDFEDLSFLKCLNPSAAVIDMVYASGGTRLTNAALTLGLRASGGERLLYHQGVLAFKLWTGFEYDGNVSLS